MVPFPASVRHRIPGQEVDVIVAEKDEATSRDGPPSHWNGQQAVFVPRTVSGFLLLFAARCVPCGSLFSFFWDFWFQIVMFT